LLGEKGFIALPFHVPYMSNKGNYVASLGQVCRYLAIKLRKRGGDIYRFCHR